MAVTIFLATDLRGRDLIDERLRTLDERACLEGEVGLVDLGLELVHVGQQFVRGLVCLGLVVCLLGVVEVGLGHITGVLAHIGLLRRPQETLETVETGERLGAVFGVIPAHVDCGVEVGERLGNRLDPLEECAGEAELRLRGLQVTGLHGLDEGGGLRGESVDLPAHVVEVAGLGLFDVGRGLGLFLRLPGDLELLADTGAHHARFACRLIRAGFDDLDRQLAGQTGADVLDLAEHPIVVAVHVELGDLVAVVRHVERHVAGLGVGGREVTALIG